MNKQYLKLFIILFIVLLPVHSLSAQDIQDNNAADNIKTTDNSNNSIDVINVNDDTTKDTSANSAAQTENENSGTFKIIPNKIKPEVKPKDDIKINRQEEKPSNLNNDIKINNKFNESIKRHIPPSIVIFLKRYHLDFTTLLAIFGLFGTFLGLLSTWTIYLLNKKTNDPLFIDRKNSAIKYIEVIDKIKESLNKSAAKRLDTLLNSALSESLSSAESEELINLISFYKKCSIAISEIPLADVHDHYKKHIKQRNIEIFNSFIALYKMIEVDGKFYSETEGMLDYKNLDSINVLTEVNAEKWKHKVITLLSIEEKANIIKKIITKDLRK